MSKIEEVHVKERAFLAMLLSCIEVYRHETIGLLLGYEGKNAFIVEYAIPYQTAVKGYSWVAPKSQASERMVKILEHMPINVIGDFHSHTQWGDFKGKPIPSGEDIADMEFNKVHIIVAVNDKEKEECWHHREDGVIVGSISDYAVELGAHILVDNYKSKPVRLICPSATGLSY
ncbi:MAG: Mov34/MPN/PAD-1 family protein [bacterium]|nr:Mov34/MPN/PAD-1 family protein [bacterium]